MLLSIALAWGAPIATYGLDAADGTAVWDASGTSHGCLEGSHNRINGVVEGGVELRGGHIVWPLSAADPGGVAAYVRGDADGVVLALGEIELWIEDGAWVLGGLTLTDPPPSPGIWQHVAVTLADGVATLWIAQLPMGSTIVDGPGPIVVGSSVDGLNPWRGSVDEVAVLEGLVVGDDLRVLTTGFRGPTDGADCGDYDGDGLDDLVEAAIGTDPTRRDSDGDTFDDLTEVVDPADPVDTDQDGLIDALDDDDDNDGISSVRERISDADGDGSPDLDPDGDGLENGVDLDSDDDGVPDQVEGIEDSDGDGIPDFLDAVDDRAQGGLDTGPVDGAGVDGKGDEAGCGCAAVRAPGWGAWLRRRR